MNKKLTLYKGGDPERVTEYLISYRNEPSWTPVKELELNSDLLLIDGVWVFGVKFVSNKVTITSTKDLLVKYGVTLENFLDELAERTSSYINIRMDLISFTREIDKFVRKKLTEHTTLDDYDYRVDVTRSFNVWLLSDNFENNKNIIAKCDLEEAELFIWEHPINKTKHVFVESYETNNVHYLGLKNNVLNNIL